ncbi:type II secretion system protein [Halobacteriovorax sp. CON-3]|uniref:type II secretion system protein n=1 Tax=Halobacteriovorax sp. CON-3 TaxID=3157710 RepID=UPI003721207E
MMFLKNEKGLTLAEIMVAIGLFGIVSLGVLKIIQTTTEVTKKSKIDQELMSLRTTSSATLLNSDSCTQTIGVGQNVTEGLLISSIRNRRGQEIISLNQNFANGQITIKSLELVDLYTEPDTSGNLVGDVFLEITFYKKSSLSKKGVDIKKRIPLSLELTASNDLIRCFSAEENALLTSLMEICQGRGGDFDPVTKSCQLKDYNHVSPDTTNYQDIVSTKYLENYNVQMLKEKYVDTKGDTMTGDLNNIVSLCINGECRETFTNQICPTGKVLKKINTDGQAECVSVTCDDPKKFYVGLNSDGTAHCKDFPNNTCSLDEYVSKVNDDGSVVCTELPPEPDRNCLTVNGNAGAISRIDRNGNHTCVEMESYYGKYCPSGQVFAGYMSDGTPSCKYAKLEVQKTSRWTSFSYASNGWIIKSCGSNEYVCGKEYQIGVGSGHIQYDDTESYVGISGKGDTYKLRAKCCKYVTKFTLSDTPPTP